MPDEVHRANGARFAAKDDMIIAWCRRERKAFEPETTAWMFDRMAERGGWFVDIGAGTGWFAIPMAMRGHDVVAFEPNPAVFTRLIENCTMNGVSFPVVPGAASDRDGMTTFWRNPAVRLTSGGSIEAATCARPEAIEVATVTADEILSACKSVALVKVDVEGHEMAVLRGAAQTIAEHRPHLVLEANTAAHREQLAAWLEAESYEWRQADERNLLCSPQS